jgi:hypothetical protein
MTPAVHTCRNSIATSGLLVLSERVPGPCLSLNLKQSPGYEAIMLQTCVCISILSSTNKSAKKVRPLCCGKRRRCWPQCLVHSKTALLALHNLATITIFMSSSIPERVLGLARPGLSMSQIQPDSKFGSASRSQILHHFAWPKPLKRRPPYAQSSGLLFFPLQPLLLCIINQPCVLSVMA